MSVLDHSAPLSVNNKLIVEQYHKEDLKAEIKNGFAMTSQKVTVKGLTILMDAKLNDGTIVPKGYKAYIKESDLHSQHWAKGQFKSDAVDGSFMIVDLMHVEFFSAT